LNIRDAAVSHIELKKIDMSLRFLIPFVSAAFFASPLSAQDKNQPTVDDLVAKNVEAKGGATALKSLQTLRSTGKLLVQQGQIELGYLQTRKRPDDASRGV